MKHIEKTAGLTRDTGWQFGIRKTFPRPQPFLWDFMFSDRGLRIWLGKLREKLEVRKTYVTAEGIEGKVNVLVPYSHIRMTWKMKAWENSTILQVRVMGNDDRGVISFHLEKLLSIHQREEMKVFWSKKISELESAVMNK